MVAQIFVAFMVFAPGGAPAKSPPKGNAPAPHAAKQSALPDDALDTGRPAPFREDEVAEAEVLALNARTGFAAVKVYTRLPEPNAGLDGPLPVDCHYPGMPARHAEHGVALVLWPLTDTGAFDRTDVYSPAATPEECGAKADNETSLAAAKALFAKHGLDVKVPPKSAGEVAVTETDITPGGDIEETATRFGFRLDDRLLGTTDVRVGMYGRTRMEAEAYRDGDKTFLFLTTTHEDMSGTSITFEFVGLRPTNVLMIPAPKGREFAPVATATAPKPAGTPAPKR